MTLELWNTFATFGTFVVIAATAIAALVQLRHARGSNQIAAITELQNAAETPLLVASEQFVKTELANKMKDPEFRYQIANVAARTPDNQVFIQRVGGICNHYEMVGLLVKRGLVDRDIALDLWCDLAVSIWNKIAPYVVISRESLGPAVSENFEYFIVLCHDWLGAHPAGAYPAGVRRVNLKNEWLEADRQYAASRASA